MASKQKVSFSGLIGKKCLSESMHILDWMLSTGIDMEAREGWSVYGINKAIFGYSANNNNNREWTLPEDYDALELFFDAAFARAIFYTPKYEKKFANLLKEWREKERILPNKYRMFDFGKNYTNSDLSTYILLKRLFKLKGLFLRKELHHPTYADRLVPKIIAINIFTKGRGWVVSYRYSFLKFDYEDGWSRDFKQNKNESIRDFLNRAYEEILTNIEK